MPEMRENWHNLLQLRDNTYRFCIQMLDQQRALMDRLLGCRIKIASAREDIRRAVQENRLWVGPCPTDVSWVGSHATRPLDFKTAR